MGAAVSEKNNGAGMKFYRLLSLTLAFAFVVVGVLFVTYPDGVIAFFNALSAPLGMRLSPLAGFNFYLILAGSYMYVVAVLAFMMYRFPANYFFPLLLAHAKLASSTVSIIMFIFQARYLIYIANFVVDGVIGALAFYFFVRIRKEGN